MHEDQTCIRAGRLFAMPTMNAEELPPPTPPAPTVEASIPPRAPNIPQWQSEQLLRGSKEVLIHHGEEVYRLRLTRQGKLILYK